MNKILLSSSLYGIFYIIVYVGIYAVSNDAELAASTAKVVFATALAATLVALFAAASATAFAALAASAAAFAAYAAFATALAAALVALFAAYAASAAALVALFAEKDLEASFLKVFSALMMNNALIFFAVIGVTQGDVGNLLTVICVISLLSTNGGLILTDYLRERDGLPSLFAKTAGKASSAEQVSA